MLGYATAYFDRSDSKKQQCAQSPCSRLGDCLEFDVAEKDVRACGSGVVTQEQKVGRAIDRIRMGRVIA